MSKLRVLIADDSPHALNGLQSILSADPGIEVVGEAANGSEAVAKARELQPDIILMDAQMPEMDGVQATRLIKKQLPGIKVLFMAVHFGFIAEALAVGADSYILKDCGRREMVRAVRELGRWVEKYNGRTFAGDEESTQESRRQRAA